MIGHTRVDNREIQLWFVDVKTPLYNTATLGGSRKANAEKYEKFHSKLESAMPG